MRRSFMLAMLMVLLLIAAGCSSGGSSVDVALSEWVVSPDPTSVSAGEITFKASNEGAEAHELVIVRADSAAGLPTDETGKVDEAGLPAGAFIGEIEEFAAGSSEEGTFDLSAGTYILFCNIVEEEADGSFESHFQEGMHTVFTVNE